MIGISQNRQFRSALNLCKQAYESEKRYRTRNFAKFQKPQQKYAYKKQPFQLYNENQKTWAIQVDQAPILLSLQDIKQWLTFRTNTLKRNQLYIWHATQFDWIPLWAMENEFLLTELD